MPKQSELLDELHEEHSLSSQKALDDMNVYRIEVQTKEKYERAGELQADILVQALSIVKTHLKRSDNPYLALAAFRSGIGRMPG